MRLVRDTFKMPGEMLLSLQHPAAPPAVEVTEEDLVHAINRSEVGIRQSC